MPFLVPWDKVVGWRRKKGFWGERHELQVRDGTRAIDIVLSAAAVRELENSEELAKRCVDLSSESRRK